jgi:hypothetical protein
MSRVADALAPAIGRAAVAHVKRLPAADLVAGAGRAIAGMRVIPHRAKAGVDIAASKMKNVAAMAAIKTRFNLIIRVLRFQVYLGGLQCVSLSQHLVVPS